MNQGVVRLSKQELRHAQEQGECKDFGGREIFKASQYSKWDFLSPES
jgi:hypothetical protein